VAALIDVEIKRLLKFLRKQINDTEKLAEIEDELRSDYGTEYLREPEIVSFFQRETLYIRKIWKLKIISYTQMRMVQRGIGEDEIIGLFERFLDYCEIREILVTVGAYTIVGKLENRKNPVTLRIDVDEIGEKSNKAHTVTVFVGQGETSETFEINLIN
jgi:hypothetical protein